MVLCVINVSAKTLYISLVKPFSSFSVLILNMSITSYIFMETRLRSCYPLETPTQQMPSSWQGRERSFLCRIYFSSFSCSPCLGFMTAHCAAELTKLLLDDWLWSPSHIEIPSRAREALSKRDDEKHLIPSHLLMSYNAWAQAKSFPRSGAIGSPSFTQLLSSMKLLGS